LEKLLNMGGVFGERNGFDLIAEERFFSGGSLGDRFNSSVVPWIGAWYAARVYGNVRFTLRVIESMVK